MIFGAVHFRFGVVHISECALIKRGLAFPNTYQLTTPNQTGQQVALSNLLSFLGAL
jgi:hypothetical protein